MHWMLRAKSHLSRTNKRLLYFVELRPIWTYSIPLWGSAANSNIQIIQRLEDNTLRKITGAPWYISTHQLHQDLALETVHQIAARATIRYVERLLAHTNMLLEDPATWRLKRKTATVANISSRFLIHTFNKPWPHGLVTHVNHHNQYYVHVKVTSAVHPKNWERRKVSCSANYCWANNCESLLLVILFWHRMAWETISKVRFRDLPKILFCFLSRNPVSWVRSWITFRYCTSSSFLMAIMYPISTVYAVNFILISIKTRKLAKIIYSRFDEHVSVLHLTLLFWDVKRSIENTHARTCLEYVDIRTS